MLRDTPAMRCRSGWSDEIGKEPTMRSATAHCDRIIGLIDACLSDYDRSVGAARPAGHSTPAPPRTAVPARSGPDAVRLVPGPGLRLL
jgi:hypothetical protein